MSAVSPAIGRSETSASINLDGQISLIDTTKPPEEELDSPASGSADEGSGTPLIKTSTKNGRRNLREQIAQRKYAKYSEARYLEEQGREGETDTDKRLRPGMTARGSTLTVPDHEEGQISRTTTATTKSKSGTLRQRGTQRFRGLLGHKHKRKKVDGDAEIDVLYENQRGQYIFGMPYFSSKSLLNFDPPAWTNTYGEVSSMDISNAQVPDPSWEWAWRMWYVDMSGDIDEQGWQYSFMFQTRFAWHGSHPWFHSFVRRRRWIRKRVRKHRHLPDGRVEGGRTMSDAHKLNADYFTIHPSKTLSRTSSDENSIPADNTTGPDYGNQEDKNDEDEEASETIDTIQVLLRRLKKGSVDREKIKAVLEFIEEGGQELYYLADEIPHILSLFLYQYTRRQLLTAMIERLDGSFTDQNNASLQRESKREDDSVDSEYTQNPDTRPNVRKEYLTRAIEAADQQLQNLEYWSDIREVVQQGESLTAAEVDQGWDKGWQGLDTSGA